MRILKSNAVVAGSNPVRITPIQRYRDNLLVGQNDQSTIFCVPVVVFGQIFDDHQVSYGGVILEDVQSFDQNRSGPVRTGRDEFVDPAVARSDVDEIRKFSARFNSDDGQPLGHAGPDEHGTGFDSDDRVVEQGVVLQEVEARFRQDRVVGAAGSGPRARGPGLGHREPVGVERFLVFEGARFEAGKFQRIPELSVAPNIRFYGQNEHFKQ